MSTKDKDTHSHSEKKHHKDADPTTGKKSFLDDLDENDPFYDLLKDDSWLFESPHGDKNKDKKSHSSPSYNSSKKSSSDDFDWDDWDSWDEKPKKKKSNKKLYRGVVERDSRMDISPNEMRRRQGGSLIASAHTQTIKEGRKPAKWQQWLKKKIRKLSRFVLKMLVMCVNWIIWTVMYAIAAGSMIEGLFNFNVLSKAYWLELQQNFESGAALSFGFISYTLILGFCYLITGGTIVPKMTKQVMGWLDDVIYYVKFVLLTPAQLARKMAESVKANAPLPAIEKPKKDFRTVAKRKTDDDPEDELDEDDEEGEFSGAGGSIPGGGIAPNSIAAAAAAMKRGNGGNG